MARPCHPPSPASGSVAERPGPSRFHTLGGTYDSRRHERERKRTGDRQVTFGSPSVRSCCLAAVLAVPWPGTAPSWRRAARPRTASREKPGLEPGLPRGAWCPASVSGAAPRDPGARPVPDQDVLPIFFPHLASCFCACPLFSRIGEQKSLSCRLL